MEYSHYFCVQSLSVNALTKDMLLIQRVNNVQFFSNSCIRKYLHSYSVYLLLNLLSEILHCKVS